MGRDVRHPICDRLARRRWLGVWLVAIVAAQGCGAKSKATHQSVSEPPAVQLIHPEVRTIVRVVGQPSFIESYERTSIFPKVMSYIEKWNVDIGDEVKAGEVLCTLFAPELVEDYKTKKATVVLDEQRVELAKVAVLVAKDNVQAAEARVTEAKAILGKYQSEVDRWATEIKRLENEVKRGIVDPQILLESTNQWKSTLAARDAAKATILKEEADLLSRKDELAKAKVDVAVAEADLAVAESAAEFAKAWMDYLTLPAPYDGVIVARNANKGDFVLPLTGDPTAMQRAPHLAPGGSAAPIYVVDRTDIVRIFVDIPEEDANYVKKGSKASVLVQAYRDEPLEGTVTRTSWALNVKSRTLRAEIDLPNPGSQLLPGMYAYADVTIERPGVWALPRSALTARGDQTYCWRYVKGKAVWTEVETGVGDDEWIEVTRRGAPGSQPGHGGRSRLARIDGSEQVILGDLSFLTNGAPVRVAKSESESKAPHATPEKGSSSSRHAVLGRRSP